ncbi:hypothetical protein H5410_044835 [Solanum commersonii]|uniref:Uncharacterized protein n=1 Tax=Solanum commersonii TaxID=4109 RepID=A0A9J5X7W7_SOLCO|nr:hypothetical protein H5410_044835 [Solanum commersonii]
MHRGRAISQTRSGWNFKRAQARNTAIVAEKIEVEYNDLLYKNNGDFQNCNNYRGIKLQSHKFKIG